MTLIVKELVIRGVVTQDTTRDKKEVIDKRRLKRHFEEMEKSIKKECIATVMSKLKSKKPR